MANLDYFKTPGNVPTGTLAGLFLDTVDRFGDGEAFRYHGGGAWPSITYREALERVKEVSGALDSLGVERGDRIALLSDNRPEWALTDYGALCSGVVDVPIYATLISSQVQYVLENSGARIVFVEDGVQLDKIRDVRDACPDLEWAVTFEPVTDTPDWCLSWDDFLLRGREAMEQVDDDQFRERARASSPEDVATMIYTSGTTGPPKGVQLTHDNLYSNVKASATVLDVNEDDLTLSFLPVSHVLQRMVDYLFFSEGCTLAYGQSIHTVADDLKVVRPTKVVSVPRLYEKVYQKVMDAEGVKARLVQWAREVGDAWAEEKLAGREPSRILKVVWKLADLLVFRKIRAGVGGRLDYFVSGGAPLSPEINRFFFGAGITILEGYGLTETSPVTNVNLPERIKIGTVGPPVPGTEIRIADDGEILVRGRQVMKGYYKLPEKTEEVLEPDGWFHTGDIGELDEDGYLTITDRKKDLIVTAGGKNIAPQPIENRLKKNPYVDQAVMIGDRRNFPSLLVVPSFGKLEEWARKQGISFSGWGDLVESPEVQAFLREEIEGELEGLSGYEKPKKLGILKEEFTIEGGALTPTQKVKRRVVEGRYKELIDAFYLEENLEKDVFAASEPAEGASES